MKNDRVLTHSVTEFACVHHTVIDEHLIMLSDASLSNLCHLQFNSSAHIFHFNKWDVSIRFQ